MRKKLFISKSFNDAKNQHIFYWFCQKPLFAWLTKSYPNSLRILATFSSSLPTTLPTDWNVNQMRNYMPSTTTSHKSISNYRKKSVHHNFVRFPALGLKCDSFSRNFGLNWRASVLIALHFNFFLSEPVLSLVANFMVNYNLLRIHLIFRPRSISRESSSDDSLWRPQLILFPCYKLTDL